MAEPFSIAASAIQVAGAGLSLAKTLHAYVEAVKSAQKHIKGVATEVKLTASVLEHLGALLKESEAEKLCTPTVLSDAQDALEGCKSAFVELEEAFDGAVKVLPDGKRTVSSTARFAWPFKKGKLEALQANLERLKSTLLLMLSVLGYAREKATRPAEVLSLQRVQIQNLVKAKDDATLRYEELLLEFQNLRVPYTDAYSQQSVVRDKSPWIKMSATSTRPSRQPQQAPRDLDAFAQRLDICADAISRLADDVSYSMANYKEEPDLIEGLIRSSYDNVGHTLTHLFASGPTTSNMGSGSNSIAQPLAPLPAGQPSASHSFEKPHAQSPSSASFQQGVHSERSGNDHFVLEDYSFQLMMLEQQNKQRLLMARQEQEAQASNFSNGMGVGVPNAAHAFESEQPRMHTPPAPITPLNPFCFSKGQRPSDAQAAHAQQQSAQGDGQTGQQPTHDYAQHSQNMGTPFGDLGDDHLERMHLDFATDGGDTLDNFDFDAFLKCDGDEPFAFDAALDDDADALSATVKEADPIESPDEQMDGVDDVDELIKRWTTVGV